MGFSVRDENLHAMAGAWCFKELLRQSKEIGYDGNSVVPYIFEMFIHNVIIMPCFICNGFTCPSHTFTSFCIHIVPQLL